MPYRHGHGGTGGISAVFDDTEYDDELVEVVAERTSGIPPEIVCVAPQSGKDYCWDDFVHSLSTIPFDHLVVCDNSNSVEHQARLTDLLSRYESYTLIRNTNPAVTIENSEDPVELVARCGSMYSSLYRRVDGLLTQPEKQMVVNLEDDIGVQPDTFTRLLNDLKMYDEVGTVIGDCRCRRAKVLSGRDLSLACNFREFRLVGGSEQTGIIPEFVKPKPLGVEPVGGGHMGLWLTRAVCLKQVGMDVDPNLNLHGHDFQYGYRLNKAGHKFIVDWSARLQHFHEVDGVKVSI